MEGEGIFFGDSGEESCFMCSSVGGFQLLFFGGIF